MQQQIFSSAYFFNITNDMLHCCVFQCSLVAKDKKNALPPKKKTEQSDGYHPAKWNNVSWVQH